jgi:hypothetical protein
MPWKCAIGPHIVQVKPHDGFCSVPEHFGEPLVEVADQDTSLQPEIELGLCVLVCDASGSMEEPAFVDNPAAKLKIVAGAVDRAIADLVKITLSDTAYIAIVAFGGRADLVRDRSGKPFVKSVAEIIQEFPSGLGEYLFEYFRTDAGNIDRGYTDITAALRLAREIYDGAMSGNLSRWGIEKPVGLLKQDILTAEKGQISIPNLRALIYSDGAHNPSGGVPLTNPFESVYPSPLMTAFIGDESRDANTRAGADQMRALANKCSIHGTAGYFLINNMNRYAVLRGLFRMASGTSGFCPQCLKEIGIQREMAA